MQREYILFSVRVITILGVSLCAINAWAAQGAAKAQKVTASQLPAAVKQAIKDNCRNCTIAKATREVENGVTIYDIEFKNGQGEMDVAEDGTVVDRETVVQAKDTPPPALEAI